MKDFLFKAWLYISYLWTGKDGQPSIKRVLALLFSLDFICLRAGNEGFAAIEAGLIAALLGLTSYFNLKERQLSLKNGEPDRGGIE